MSREVAIEREQENGVATIILGLCAIGLAISLYLSYTYLTGSRALCEGVGGCDYVASSSYSRVAGIPVPLLGVAGYLAIGMATLLCRVQPQLEGLLLLGVFGMALVGFLFSAFLTYVEFFVLYAICPWCVASAVTMTLIFALSAKELLTG